MGYWNNQEEYTKRGMDYDFTAAVYYNDVDVDLDNVKQVLVVWQGENEGDEWRWIFVTHDSRYAFMSGGCDYTGWDCQSSCSVEYFPTIAEAVRHMITVETNTNRWEGKRVDVIKELIKQLTTGKAITWSESFDPDKPEDF